MDTEKGLNGFDGVRGKTEEAMSEVEAEALKKCLEEKKGEQETHSKCKSKIEAFQSSSSHSKKPLGPLMLRSGSLTDVWNKLVVTMFQDFGFTALIIFSNVS